MSPNSLVPNQPYAISYYITDHTDAGTYYVQAVVYDAGTGEVLDTLNLVRQTTNNHLFSKVAQAPGDSSGHGRRIVVVATAYDDAGHTVKSTNYAQQSENYIVVRPGAGLALGGGGVDYQALNDMFSSELEKVLKGNEKAWGDMVNIITAIADRLDKIPTDKVDVKGALTPLLKTLESLSVSVTKIPTSKMDMTPTHDLINKAIEYIQHVYNKEPAGAGDMQPVHDAIGDLKATVVGAHDETRKVIGQHMNDLHTVLPKTIEDGVNNVVNPKPAEPVAEKPAEPVKPEPVDNGIDINKLVTKPEK